MGGCRRSRLREIAEIASTCGHGRLVAISPETGRVVRELGFPVAAEASVYTADGLIEALVGLVKADS